MGSLTPEDGVHKQGSSTYVLWSLTRERAHEWGRGALAPNSREKRPCLAPKRGKRKHLHKCGNGVRLLLPWLALAQLRDSIILRGFFAVVGFVVVGDRDPIVQTGNRLTVGVEEGRGRDTLGR